MMPSDCSPGFENLAVNVPNTDSLRALSSLWQLDPATLESLSGALSARTVPAGTLMFEAGQACTQYLLIQSGSVRVHLLDEAGHEIVLYRLRRGDTCILTTAALLGSTPYFAYAVTEVESVAATLQREVFDDLVARSSRFRQFVFATHARRIADLMQVVSDVAFTRVQVRLARWLLQRADAQGRVQATHDAIAVELGTAREVVTRNLKMLVNEGCVRLGTGVINITDALELAKCGQPTRP